MWRASAYAQYYDWFMQSNPTYDFQINQFDERWTTGGRYERTLARVRTKSTLNGRRRVPLRRHRRRRRRRVRCRRVRRQHQPEQHSGNVARCVHRGELVGDGPSAADGGTARRHLRLRCDGEDAGQLRRARDAIQPRVAEGRLAYTVSDDVELYGNWGEGFHSNDARGVVNPVDPVPGLSPGTGYEAGARFELGA